MVASLFEFELHKSYGFWVFWFLGEEKNFAQFRKK